MGVRLAKAMGKKYVINLREGCISWGGDFEGKYVLLIVLIFSKLLKIWIRPQKIYYNFLQFFGDGRG